MIKKKKIKKHRNVQRSNVCLYELSGLGPKRYTRIHESLVPISSNVSQRNVCFEKNQLFFLNNFFPFIYYIANKIKPNIYRNLLGFFLCRTLIKKKKKNILCRLRGRGFGPLGLPHFFYLFKFINYHIHPRQKCLTRLGRAEKIYYAVVRGVSFVLGK